MERYFVIMNDVPLTGYAVKPGMRAMSGVGADSPSKRFAHVGRREIDCQPGSPGDTVSLVADGARPRYIPIKICLESAHENDIVSI